MNFRVYIIGDEIKKFYAEAIKEYEKRLSRYCKIRLIRVKDENKLLKTLPDKFYKILISSKGQRICSEELAEKINLFGISGKSDIAIIIGTENAAYDEKISVSPMEMDLGLTATIIFEQIYRSYKIIFNEPYHK